MTKLGVLCDKFMEACWLAALVLSPIYMNIYTHRMFEPDKGTIIRSLALIMIFFYLLKRMESGAAAEPVISKPKPGKTAPGLSEAQPKRETEERRKADASKQPEPQSVPKIRNYIMLPFLAFAVFYILSVIFSAVPHNSIWGGYDRMQGLYTNASFWTIFILAAISIKTREQVTRLVSMIILTSVPIVAYCFIQRLRLDPVPWQQMDPSIRVSATMGNPIFLSAYLILTIPLTLARFTANLRENKFIAFTLYGTLAVLQVITVFLSQSRGPMMGMFGSLFMFLLLYAWFYRQRKLFWGMVGASAAGLVFLLLFNLPHIIKFQNPPDTVGIAVPSAKSAPAPASGTAIAPASAEKPGLAEALWYKTFWHLMNIQYVRQFGRLLERGPGSSGRTRIILWQGVWKLITDKDERHRFFIGWGPESLSTVYYKNYTMELSALEGSNVHADRTHNHYLDVWVMHGLLGLIAYLALLSGIFYTAYKTIKAVIGASADATGPPSNDILIIIGLMTALIAHLGEIFVGIAIVSTYTHFWVITAAIYAIYKTGILTALTGPLQTGKPQPETSALNEQTGPQWGFYLLLSYAVLTVVIAFILFYFSWPAARMLTPEIKSTRDALLNTFCIWLLAGIILGIVAWPRYLFWTYAGQTVMMAVIMVRRYWPDDNTDTDLLMIYSWLWILAGIIVGALSLRRKEKPEKLWAFSNVLAGLIIASVIFYIIADKNLSVLRADAFYKFCYSYDQSAEEAIRAGEKNAAANIQAGKPDEATKIRQAKRDESFQIRLACIRYFQKTLNFAPNERAYLNGAGRNFLELAKIAISRDRESNAATPNKLAETPTIKDIVDANMAKRDGNGRFYTDYSSRDFAICSLACIRRAYELDPKNFERIIALIRIYRYMGEIDSDKKFIEKALALCDEARKASPLNTKTDDEIRELRMRLQRLK